ncbi:hypothetical protein GF352_04510 [archaeon]|nr:hypothetical protein [archaeon]
MRKLALGFFCLMLSAALAAPIDVLVLEFNIDNASNIDLLDVRLMKGTETMAEGTDYSVVLLSASDEVLHTTYFDVVLTAYGDNYPFLPGQEDVGVEVGLNETRVIVRVPYNSSAAKFEIREGTTVLLQQDINLCDGDGVCEPASGENYLSCLADCPSGSDDDYCDEVFDDKCDPDCGEQGRADKDTDCTCGNGVCDPREDSITCPDDCGQAVNELTTMIYGAIAGIIVIPVVIVVIVIVLRRRKKKK